MAGFLFRVTVRTDAELLEQKERALLSDQFPQWSSTPYYDIIVLDEFQDCTEIIFWLTNCFILAGQRRSLSQARLAG